MSLHFEAFALGPGNNCTASYVRVYDGKSSSDPWLMGACGNTIPPDVSSSGANMFIQFKTDGSEDDHGFQATFDFLTLGCGQNYDASIDQTGIISSPYAISTCSQLHISYHCSCQLCDKTGFHRIRACFQFQMHR